MKRLYAPFLLCMATLFTTAAFAQDFEAPVDATLDTKEDYVKYEKDVIKAAKWLESTPILKDDPKRTLVNLFVLKWITGSPTVTVTMRPVALDLVDKNPQLLTVFMASYTRYVLENNYSKDDLKGYLAGIKSIINLYNLGGDIKKDKDLQKVIEADKAGTLEDWLKENYEKKVK